MDDEKNDRAVEREAEAMFRNQFTALLPPEQWNRCRWSDLADDVRAGWLAAARERLAAQPPAASTAVVGDWCCCDASDFSALPCPNGKCPNNPNTKQSGLVVDLQNERLCRENEQLRADLEAARQQAADWRAERDQLRTWRTPPSPSAKPDTLEKCHALIEYLDVEISGAVQDYLQAKKDRDAAIKNLRDAQADSFELRRAVEADRDRLAQQVAELTCERAVLGGEVEGLTAERDRYRDQVSGLTADLSRTRAERDDAFKAQKAAELRIVGLRKQLSEQGLVDCGNCGHRAAVTYECPECGPLEDSDTKAAEPDPGASVGGDVEAIDVEDALEAADAGVRFSQKLNRSWKVVIKTLAAEVRRLRDQPAQQAALWKQRWKVAEADRDRLSQQVSELQAELGRCRRTDAERPID